MFKSINPATGEEIATRPELDADQIEHKLRRADGAFRQWRKVDILERAALLSRIADEFEARKDVLARMATAEMGKTYMSAIAEVEKCVAGFRHYASHGPAMLETQSYPLSAGGKAVVHWLPLGPILAIMPWNFPYWQTVRFLAPTLLAGNVGLLKHASIVQGCAGLIEEAVLAAGSPEGLFQNLAIKSGAIGALIADERIAAVTLTGSEGAGAAVAEQAGRNLKKVVLELGGSDPFIVMPSADLGKAVTTAVKARIQNSGQSCICAKRMIVHADIYDAFLDQFAQAMRSVKIGDPMDEATEMGPLSSFEQRETVLGQIRKAQRAGGKLLLGGDVADLPGAYLSAGIIVDLPRDSEPMQEEIFGPIAIVMRAASIDEAIDIANDIPFGLGSSVWTRDAAESQRFVRDLACGMTAINQMLASSPEAPFGGIKRSGHGRELGPFGLHEFMNLKTVLVAEETPSRQHAEVE